MAALPDPSTSAQRKRRKSPAAVAVIASELDLVGLNSVDFLVSDDAVWLIEINPRPGATLDVFESNEDPLVCASYRRLRRTTDAGAATIAFKAAEIVYAPHDLVVRKGGNWPDWAVDRSPPGTRIAAGDPLCTALGSGATVDLARMCANERARKIIALVQEADH